MPLPLKIDLALSTILSSHALEKLEGLLFPKTGNANALLYAKYQLQLPVWQIALETSEYAFGEEEEESEAATAATGSVSIETDLDDYAPGSTAIFTASGFDIGATLTFEVEHVSGPGPDGTFGTADDEVVDLGGEGHDPWEVTDGGAGDLDGEANGTIVTEWYVNPDDSLGEVFLLTATDKVTGQVATTSFTDAIFNITTQTVNSVAPDADSEVIINGAIFAAATVREGSGTGNYNTILAVHGGDDTAEGFQTDATTVNPDLDDVDLAKTETTLLSEMTIIVIDGIEYVEYRVDLNEPNNGTEPLISLTEFKIWSSTDGAIESKAVLEAQTLIYDLGDNVVYMEDTSSGSGTDDYAVFIPVSLFDYSDPENTFIYLYVNMGEDDPLEETGGFEEWNLQNAGFITGLKFDDVNGDGVRDPDGVNDMLGDDDDEVPIEGVIIYIDENNNGIRDMGERWTTTDMNGEFAFYGVGITDEDIIIREEFSSLPSALTVPTNGIFDGVGDDPYYWVATLEETGDEYFLEIGNFTPRVDISGYKREDADGDGDFADMDDGVPNWTIYLYEESGDNPGTFDPGEDILVATTMTDMNGYYEFTGVLPGDYWVVEDDNVSDWTNTTPITIELDGLVAGDDSQDNNFLNFQLFDISGTKYEDADGDGSSTGDSPPDVVFEIALYIVDGSGTIIPTMGFPQTALTDENGDYSFTDLGPLGPGEFYAVREEAYYQDSSFNPDGSPNITGATRIEIDAMNSDWLQTFGPDLEDEITPASGMDSTGNDFGNFELFDINGIKFEDDNGDGVMDMGEDAPDLGDGGDPVIFQMGLFIVTDGTMVTGPIATTNTATDGSFSFEDLAPLDPNQEYRVREIGYYDGDPIPANLVPIDDASSNWVQTTTDPADIDPMSGVDVDIVFGNAEYGAITGEKYYDIDLQESIGPDDVPLEGWTVYLFGEDADDGSGGGIAGNGVLEAGEIAAAMPLDTTMTDSSGVYLFEGLLPGDYFVVEDLPMGWTAYGTPTQYLVTVSSGETVGGLSDNDTDFQNYYRIPISGVKYEDFNADGMVNGLDDGLENWTITIYRDGGDGIFDFGQMGSDDEFWDSTLTDADGNWDAEIEFGTFFVVETLQGGWAQSGPGVSPTEGYYVITTDYFFDLPDGPRLEIVSSEDQDMNDVAEDELDFFNFQVGAITGEKYYDNDGSMTFTMDDIPLEGWTVTLYSADADDGSGGGIMGNGILEAGEIAAATPVDTQMTNTSGVYTFNNLDPGDYFIVETVPAGWTSADGTTQHLVTVTSGNTTGGLMDNDTDFLNVSSIDIAGTKYEDFNGDGMVNGLDDGLENWDIRIWFDGGDGMFDAGVGDDVLITTETTDSNGEWSTSLNMIGTYFIEEDLQLGWSQSAPGESPTEGYYEVVVGYDETGPALTIDSAQDQDMNDVAEDELDFLNWEPGAITGEKYYDNDKDDSFSMGDIPLEGWTITLYSADADDGSGGGISGNGVLEAGEIAAATPVDTQVTDMNGVYLFQDVDVGDYFIVETVPAGWSSANGTTQHLVSVTSGETTGGLMDNDTDFLNESSIDISGTKYEDFNADGMVNGDDDGLENWDIRIWFDGGDGTFDAGLGDDVLFTTATTDMDGEWTASLTMIGTYFIEEDLQLGWSQSAPGESPTEGYYEVVVGYDETGPALTIDSAEDQDMNDVAEDELDFLNWEQGAIAGKKFWDDNQNGAMDPGETFANFWEIELYDDSGSMAGVFDAGDQLITSVMTSGDGDFLFDNLDPGIYHLVEVLQDGFEQTTPASGVITVEVLSGETIGPDVDDSGTLEEGDVVFGNFRIPGNGARTPGFWKSPLGKTFYDGILDNQGDVGGSDGDDKDFEEEGWPEDDLLETYGVDTNPGDNGVPNMSDNDEFALRDVNMNGMEDEGDLFLTPQELCDWLEGGGGGGPRNAWDMLARDVAAAYLNKLNGNDLGNPNDPNDPAFWLEEGIDFLLEYDGMLVRPNSSAWKTGTNKDGGGIDPTGPDIAAGSDIHSQLAMFNESGNMEMMTLTTSTTFIQQVNFDGDDWSLAVAQDWALKHQEPSSTSEMISVKVALEAPASGFDEFTDEAWGQASGSEPLWKIDGTLLLA